MANQKKSLKVVAWELGAAMKTGVAGCETCLGCRHNTATDVTLFGQEGQTGKEGAGFCRLPAGFEAKRALTQREIEKAVAKMEKDVKAKKLDKDEAGGVAAVRDAIPDFVRVPNAQRQVRKGLGMGPEKAAGAKSTAEKKDPQKEALLKWGRAYHAWAASVEKKLLAEINAQPARKLAALLLAAAHPAWPDYFVPMDEYHVREHHKP